MKVRIILGIMICIAMFFVFELSSTMKFYYPVMVDYGISTLPDNGPRFHWSTEQQEKIVSTFYYGYLISSFIGGTLAEYWSGRNVIGYGIFLAGIFRMSIPTFAGKNYKHVARVRFCTGLVTGSILPASNNLISKWAPLDEKCKFVALLLAGPLGAILTLPFINSLNIYIGWRMTFFIEGLMFMLFAVIWFFLIKNDPKSHTFIKESEVKYINDSLKETITPRDNKCPPFLKMIKSIPLISLIILHVGDVSGLVFFLNYAPKFISLLFKVDIFAATMISGIPIFVRTIVAFIFGVICDIYRRRSKDLINELRILFCCISHILPGILIILIAGIPQNASTSILILLLMILAFGLNGISTNYINSQNLAPNYAGTILSMMEGFANISTIISPIIITQFANKYSLVFVVFKLEIELIFIITGLVYIITGLVFVVFGSAKLQPWNYTDQEIDKIL